MNPFVVGLLFALSEQTVRVVFRQSFRFRPRQLFRGLVSETPPFLAFGFLAGLGVVWISDQKTNHMAGATLAIVVWCSALLVRNVLECNLWWLRETVESEKYKRWYLSCAALGTVSMASVAALYVRWCDAIGVSRSIAMGCGIVTVAVYGLLVFLFSWCDLRWRRQDCRESILSLLHLYCRKSPDAAEGISKNPGAHQAQDSAYYVSKYMQAYSQRTAGLQCCCLESELEARIAARVVLGRNERRRIVREAITVAAGEYELEYQVLTLIVAREPTHGKAVDIVKKSSACASMAIFERLRKIVEDGGRLMDVEQS